MPVLPKGPPPQTGEMLIGALLRVPAQAIHRRIIHELDAAGFDGLKGHRSVGGMRASIYNACPRAAVEALVAFMKEFEQANQGAATARA